MTRTKPPRKTTGNKTGPKREFSKEQLKQIEFLSMLGATDKQIAMFFDVGVGTVEKWMRNYPDYNEARKRGGLEADMRVARALFRRAVGYSYIEKEFTAVTDPETGMVLPLSAMSLVKKTKKSIPPDVKAAIQWLKIKQRETWALPDTVFHKGSVTHLHRRLQEIPMDELTEDARKLAFEIAQKQLTTGNGN